MRDTASCLKLYDKWRSALSPSDPLAVELAGIEGDAEQITDRFYQDIVFGTAGLRGVCGAGTNRMNVYTVGRASRGIAQYVLKSGEDASRGIAIAYDCRHHSREFSELAAEIFAAAGIPVCLFPSMRPTPELSFVIRELHCAAGVNMTASHNPKEYNGYKVYWEDGAQISGAVSAGMQKEIEALDVFDDFPKMPLEEAAKKGLVHMLGEEQDEAYMAYVLSLRQRPDEQLDLSVPVVYTPLNGAGSIPMREMARRKASRPLLWCAGSRIRIRILNRFPARTRKIRRPLRSRRSWESARALSFSSRPTRIPTAWPWKSRTAGAATCRFPATRRAPSSSTTWQMHRTSPAACTPAAAALP